MYLNETQYARALKKLVPGAIVSLTPIKPAKSYMRKFAWNEAMQGMLGYQHILKEMIVEKQLVLANGEYGYDVMLRIQNSLNGKDYWFQFADLDIDTMLSVTNTPAPLDVDIPANKEPEAGLAAVTAGALGVLLASAFVKKKQNKATPLAVAESKKEETAITVR